MWGTAFGPYAIFAPHSFPHNVPITFRPQTRGAGTFSANRAGPAAPDKSVNRETASVTRLNPNEILRCFGAGRRTVSLLAASVTTALVLTVAPAGLVPAAAQARTAPASFADLSEKLLPAVVNISSTQAAPQRPQGQRPELPQFPPGSPFEEFFKDFFDRHGGGGGGGGGQPQDQQQQRKATSLGSGFVIDAVNGYVVTNNHVIQDADEITVILHDDTNIKAELVGRDSKTDLALLKIKTSHPLTAVGFGDSDAMRVGDWVLAIGNPFGLGGTVTAGIISARARDINAGPYDDFLQTDAAINRGNSGGPMFNMNGEVIGINTAIFSPSGGSVGIGFAIPANIARTVVAQLKEFGHTRRGWLGVRIQSVTPEIAESLGLEGNKGALVASVTPGGPAAESGILAGDVVLKFDGKEIGEMRRLPRVVAETPIGKATPVEVWRKGKLQTVQVKVGELEAAEESGLLTNQPDDKKQTPAQPPKTTDLLGLKLTGITPDLRQQYELKPEQKGVLVTDVQSGTPAAEKGIRPGDVIIELSQEEVKAPADVAAKVQKAREQNRKSVLLLIERQGDLRFVALPLNQG